VIVDFGNPPFLSDHGEGPKDELADAFKDSLGK